MANKQLTSSVAVIGAGEVGSVIAYSLILSKIPSEILVVDPQEALRDAQVQDLSDSTFHGNTATSVRAGTHKEAGQCDIVVVTAGAKQKEGESRTDLIGRNLGILKSVIEEMKPFAKDTVLLLVTNPVDVLTYFAQEFSALPKDQVIGSGTFLDSARLRGMLAEKAGVSASSIDAFVLGEHGDSQFVAWSTASLGGISILEGELALGIDREAMAEETKKKAAAIMESKGATAYGIGGVTASICKSILSDQRNVRPISHWRKDLGCCLSLPVVLGRKGVVRALPANLNEDERKALEKSANSLRDVIKDAKKSQ